MTKMDLMSNYGYSLSYQPIFDFKSGKLAAFEGLIRCQSNSTENLSAENIITLAKEHDTLHHVDMFAVDFTAGLIENLDLVGSQIMFNINMSMNTLVHRPSVFSIVKRLSVIAKHTPIVIELTETERLKDGKYRELSRIVGDLRDANIKIAIDDWGDGHACLKLLRLFKVDFVKLDHWVISDLCAPELDLSEQARRAEIVKEKVRFAKKLGMKVIMEGIEHAAHQNILPYIEPDFVQGFAYGRPLPFQSYEALIDRPSIPLAL